MSSEQRVELSHIARQMKDSAPEFRAPLPPKPRRKWGNKRREQKPPAIRREEGKVELAPTWEDMVERKIREAQDRGVFDNPKGKGEPLSIDENVYAGEWAFAFHIMRNADIAPPWMESDKEVHALRQAVERQFERSVGSSRPRRQRAFDAGNWDAVDRYNVERELQRRKLAEAVGQLNAEIKRFNLIVPFAWLQKLPVSLDRELARFDAACPPL